MSDKSKIQESFTKEELLDKPSCILINEISEEGQCKLIEDIEKVLRYNKTFIPVIIDSYGGDVYSALGMYDILENLDCDVITVVVGKAMSAGALLFSVGDYRYITPNSTIMIHQVSTIAYGKEEEFRNESEEVTRLNDLLFKILDKRCKKKRGYWKSVLKNNEFTDVFVNATDAVDTHALATHVGYPNIETEITIERTWTPPEE